ncbi:hypothetical protein ABIE09_002139 [Lysobacter enzymogenes]|uniref:hypothetical protein n=1 Tax=Lysobacter enzymogenes TaxID=69 RepID=UPI0033961C05
MNRGCGSSAMARIVAFVALASIVCIVASCGSTRMRGSGRGGPDKVSTDAVTVENLLRWSVEGSVGIDKVLNGLKRTFEMTPVGVQGLGSAGPAKLADGYILSFATIRGLSGAIDIGVKEEPCYSPERAAGLVGGATGKVELDAHMIDHGKTYTTGKNGFYVSFATTDETYRCVKSIHMWPMDRKEP